ncbi:MAG TPA: hypothetical protein VHP14_21290 [Anaerolineales bacterium]|nr:hypothetical protein [Anaerolineales bacterium]
MNPYSHVVIASKLESLIKPENPAEYYWGAIAPDVRYIAGVPRGQTHLPAQKIVEFIPRYPNLRSFIQGYLVHCLSDEVHMGEIFFRQFPFSVLKRKLSYQHIAVVLELFCFENEKVNISMSDTHNEVLTELGVDEAASARLAHSIGQYVMAGEAHLAELFRLLGPKDNSHLEKYIKAATSFQKNWLLKNALFFGIRQGKIIDAIVSRATALLSVSGI